MIRSILLSRDKYFLLLILCINITAGYAIAAASENATSPVSSATTYSLSQEELDTLTSLADENNDSAAAFRLYQYYTFSKHDESKQLHFLGIAATQGNNVAQLNLASLYCKQGRLEEAYEWAQKAKSGGNYLADAVLAEIASAQRSIKKQSQHSVVPQK